jgi:hypothetical protein
MQASNISGICLAAGTDIFCRRQGKFASDPLLSAHDEIDTNTFDCRSGAAVPGASAL